MADSSAPVLSFPAILRNPGLNSRFAHLHGPTATTNNFSRQAAPTIKKRHRTDNEGKRWVRRKDNARFTGNPHIVTASKNDYLLQTPQKHATFPEPLPSYLPRTAKVPTPTPTVTDPSSANAGRFSVSLKGMRKDLRRAGGRAEALVRDVEKELVTWMAEGGVMLAPNAVDNGGLEPVEKPVGSSGSIVEVSRTPLQLVWRIADDSFARYVVHCCARYHEVVSFSKGADAERLTYLLRPNVARPDRRLPVGLETPPTTDLDYSSNADTDIDSDFVSDREMDELEHPGNLSSIAESPGPGVSELPKVPEESWSVIDENEEAEDFDSGSEVGSGMEGSVDILQPRLESLALNSSPANIEDIEKKMSEAEITNKSVPPMRPHPLQSESPRRQREWTSARSASSPSRSPARGRRPRRRVRAKKLVVGSQRSSSFYDYLFM